MASLAAFARPRAGAPRSGGRRELGHRRDWAVDASGETGRTPVPHPPKAQGGHCVADTEFMRRNHMKMLYHQRNETVHLGVRGEPYS